MKNRVVVNWTNIENLKVRNFLESSNCSKWEYVYCNNEGKYLTMNEFYMQGQPLDEYWQCGILIHLNKFFGMIRKKILVIEGDELVRDYRGDLLHSFTIQFKEEKGKGGFLCARVKVND